MNRRDLLSAINFGQRVAEDESEVLATYFVETDHWRRLYAGEVDVVYGPKGSGKSALYSLLLARTNEIFDRNVVLVPAENPRGAPAFRDLVIDPPATEAEFVGLWKLYFATLLCGAFEEVGVGGSEAKQLQSTLSREGLIRGNRSLQSLLGVVVDYVRRALRPAAVEGHVDMDPVTQLPKGFTGRISFREPTAEGTKLGLASVDHLLRLADRALKENSDFNVWLILDRLDVAFAETPALEQNALRALFRVYLDVLGFSNIRLKIFLRTDIWRRITSSGFREASHITRHMTIDWNRSSLLNLVVRRAIQNERLRSFYDVSVDSVLQSTDAQERFFYRMCPEQVDVGPNKPRTFDWILGRTRDGTARNAPRELIHLLNSLRDVQARRLEIGEAEPEAQQLFVRAAFKDALPEVSRVRLEQTLYAEYPGLRDNLERLRTAKTLQTAQTLTVLWSCTEERAAQIAKELVDIGFFEQRGTRESPEYWVPFLYRDALDLVQGAAEADAV